jgi:ketosteroid isomerase-like protein
MGSEVEAEIRAEIAGRVRAICEKNVEGLLAHYAPEVATFDLVAPLQNLGAAAVRKRVSEWFASFRTAIDYEIRDANISTAGDVAFDHHLTHVRGTNQSGDSIDMWFRETVGYRRMGGRWLATHQHSSVPLDMNGGRALLDLRPD